MVGSLRCMPFWTLPLRHPSVPQTFQSLCASGTHRSILPPLVSAVRIICCPVALARHTSVSFFTSLVPLGSPCEVVPGRLCFPLSMRTSPFGFLRLSHRELGRSPLPQSPAACVHAPLSWQFTLAKEFSSHLKSVVTFSCSLCQVLLKPENQEEPFFFFIAYTLW